MTDRGYRQDGVKKQVFLWLDWLAEKDIDTTGIACITTTYQNIAHEWAQELLDQWQQARQEVTE